MTIPIYNEEKHICEVLEKIPEYVDYIVVVNDNSTDNSKKVVEDYVECVDKRVILIDNKENGGVGAGTIKGHLKGIELEADILVRVDGDGQMDLNYFPLLLDELIENDYDMAKGDRLSKREFRNKMPKFRKFGNFILTIMTKFITFKWDLMDPQNGYTAIKVETYKKLPINRLMKNYVYENSVLFEVSLIKGKIKDIPMPAIYGREESSIKLIRFIKSILAYSLKTLYWRVFRKKRRI